MPVVASAAVQPPSGVSHVGVGIFESRPGQLHLGILYALDGGPPRVCHLAFHFLLEDEPADAIDNLFWATSGLDEVNRQYVAARVTALRRNTNNIPYGFDSSGSCFDPETLEFIPPPPGKGLTCATFVLAYFRHMGYAFLSEASWPARAEDAEWETSIVDFLAAYCDQHGIDPQPHIGELAKDIGAYRVRPDEAAAGVITAAIPPLDFAGARAVADQILIDMGLKDPPPAQAAAAGA